MTRNEAVDNYFEWLFALVCQENKQYRKLLMRLHDRKFLYFLTNDGNRAQDGIALREKYTEQDKNGGSSGYLGGPCSVLEMMIALSIRCEVHIMDNPDIGDRTGQWFWTMIINLGLDDMNDEQYDKRKVDRVITKLLERKYKPNGEGSLFYVENCAYDLRKVEIWYQMCWYLDSIL